MEKRLDVTQYCGHQNYRFCEKYSDLVAIFWEWRFGRKLLKTPKV
jgi:hypothetical protein